MGNEINNAFERLKGNNSELSRSLRYHLNNGIDFYPVWDPHQQAYELCIHIPNRLDKATLPSWAGIELDVQAYIIKITRIEGPFFIMKQNPTIDRDGEKFLLLANSICKKLENCTLNEVNTVIIKCLKNWSEFFKKYHETILSKEEQQGLFGEFLFLRGLILKFGAQAVYWWGGPGAHDHDFGIKNREKLLATEVKTTRKKSNSVAINNEYQLESKHDFNSKLFLVYYALELNEQEGNTIVDIIQNIIELIENDSEICEVFRNKLMDAGFLFERKHEYTDAFAIRSGPHYYEITDDFPRLIKSNIPNAISNVTYILSLAGRVETPSRTFEQEINGILE